MSEPSQGRTDLSEGERAERLEEAVEAANDRLAEGLRMAQQTMQADKHRPSTLMAFDAMQDAHDWLCTVDETRESPEQHAPSHESESDRDD